MSAVFEIVTGIFNTNTQNLSIYPNPTNGKAYINTDATMHGDMDIQVLDILGKTINTEIIKNTQPNQINNFNRLKKHRNWRVYHSCSNRRTNVGRKIGGGVGNEIMKQ